MKRSVLAATILACLSGVFATEALAQGNPNTLIAQRKGAMGLQGKYFGPIYGMAAGRVPFDQRIAQRNVDYLTVLVQMPWDDFQPNTLGLPNTRAKEEILLDAPKFRQRQEALQAEVQKLQAAARSGDQAALKVSAQGVANTCNACHEAFTSFNFRFAPLQ